MPETPRPDRRPRGGRRSGDAADDAAVAALRQRLSGVLRRLPDIERKVVEQRMGLVDGVPAKPGEVASRLGLTINEVRKIEERAFNRIREVVPIRGLEKFLGGGGGTGGGGTGGTGGGGTGGGRTGGGTGR